MGAKIHKHSAQRIAAQLQHIAHPSIIEHRNVCALSWIRRCLLPRYRYFRIICQSSPKKLNVYRERGWGGSVLWGFVRTRCGLSVDIAVHQPTPKRTGGGALCSPCVCAIQSANVLFFAFCCFSVSRTSCGVRSSQDRKIMMEPFPFKCFINILNTAHTHTERVGAAVWLVTRCHSRCALPPLVSIVRFQRPRLR